MSEGSMQTPSDKDLQLALVASQEEKAEHPEGAPQALGPQMNPFWSQRACDEAMLKAMRPSTLPENQGGDTQVAAQASPPREITGAELVKGVVEENARLWHYINQMQKTKDRDYQSMQASFKEKLVGAARCLVG